ncbi:MAG: patatin-like phospholipase family protein [Cyanobacteria bacterium P01_F01_bin.150]
MVFRILSLDGGGMRGIVSAHILKQVEERLGGGPLRDHFDLIAGTSTGAIIAGAIAAGLSASEIFNIYEKEGKDIFPYRNYWALGRIPLMLKHGISAPKFSDQGLVKVISGHLGNLTLGDITPTSPYGLHVLITSYDTVRRRPVIFKSWYRHKWYKTLSLADACISSASAPTYFPAHRIDPKSYGLNQEYSLVDGGVCANNPTSCAVVAGAKLLSKRLPSKLVSACLSQIKVLSIGTGDPAQPLLWQQVRGWGLSQWAPRIADVLMDAPNDIHRYITEQLMSRSPRFANTGSTSQSNYLRLQFPLNDKLMQKLGQSPSASSRYNLRAIDDARPQFRRLLVAATDLYLDGQLDRFPDETQGRPANPTPREQLYLLLDHWSMKPQGYVL